jgi:hypothetical protein
VIRGRDQHVQLAADGRIADAVYAACVSVFPAFGNSDASDVAGEMTVKVLAGDFLATSINALFPDVFVEVVPQALANGQTPVALNTSICSWRNSAFGRRPPL